MRTILTAAFAAALASACARSEPAASEAAAPAAPAPAAGVRRTGRPTQAHRLSDRDPAGEA